MSMLSVITLTAPAMMIGAGLVALPILAHLMHRRVSRRVMFPSVLLLEAVAVSQSSLFRLRRWWLLGLRCLAVAAIVLAFAQPIWLGAQASATGGRGAAVVILVDLSASSGQQYAGVPAVHSMKADAGRVLDALSPGTDYANIVYADARPYTALPEMTSNLGVLRSEVMSFEPTYERADVAGALSLAGRMLAKQPGERRLVVLTDLQASSWSEALGTWSTQSPLPDGTRVTLLPPAHRPPNNLALHGPWLSPPTPRVDRPTRIGAMLTNHSDTAQTTTVRLRIDGRNRDTQSLALEPRQTHEVVFRTQLDKPGTHRVEFSLPGDGLPVDDRCYLVAHVVEHVPVVVVSDDDPDLPGTTGYFMTRALSPFGDARDRYRVRAVGSADVTWPILADTAAVFVGEIGLLNPAGLEALTRYVEAGGGVVIFLGDGPVVDNLKSLDRLAPDGLLPWVPEAPRSLTSQSGRLTIADGVRVDRFLQRFGEFGRDALAGLQIRRTWAGGDINQEAHTLWQYPDGAPALAWRGLGAGRLALVNISPKATHSDLGKHGVFVVLMQGLADEVWGTQKTQDPGHVVGRAVQFDLATPVDRGGTTPSIILPDGGTLPAAGLSLEDRSARIVITPPEVPGFYTAAQGDTPLDVAAVNIDPRESDLRRIGADKLQSSLRPGNGKVSAEARGMNTGLSLGLHGRAVWGWLILLAMGLFGIEMGLQGYWKR